MIRTMRKHNTSLQTYHNNKRQPLPVCSKQQGSERVVRGSVRSDLQKSNVSSARLTFCWWEERKR